MESEPIVLELPGAPKPIEAEEQSALELSADLEAPAAKAGADNGIVWPSEREARAVEPPFNQDSVPDFEEEAQR